MVGVVCVGVYAHDVPVIHTNTHAHTHMHIRATEVEAIRLSAGMRGGLRLTLVLEGVHGVRFLCHVCK